MELDEGHRYYLKPMNCPFHILVFRSRQRSYRELPMRLFEFGTVYRYEKSGVVHGLTRVRGMTQDDAHIFCTRQQMSTELGDLLTFVLDLLRDFGLEDFYLELSTRPPGKGVGSDEEWDEATEALRAVAGGRDLELVDGRGRGAFYGPKISVQARDAIGRYWQVSTIQLDFQLPQRFGLEYVGADNARHRPVMIHRALFGSVERFFAILLEHYAGALPTWLMPVQVGSASRARRPRRLRPGGGRRLARAAARVEVDSADEPLNARIRRWKLEKVPYVLVVGDDDVAAGTVGVNAAELAGSRARGASRRPSAPRCPPRSPPRAPPRRVGSPMGESGLEQLWAGWRRDYVVSATVAERDGTEPGMRLLPHRGVGPAQRRQPGGVAQRSQLRRAQRLSLRQWPSPGDATCGTWPSSTSSAPRSPPTCGAAPGWRRRPSRTPTTPTASTWEPTWAVPPARGSPGTSTSMSCPGGRGTPTS